MNKLIPAILGLVIISGSAVMADEPVAKDAKAPAAATKKVAKVKKEKAAKKTDKKAEAAAPAADAKK
jgi:hypothetical protein